MVATTLRRGCASCTPSAAPIAQPRVPVLLPKKSEPAPNGRCRRTCASDEADSSTTRASGGSRADRKSTRLNSSHVESSYAVFCLKKKKKEHGHWDGPGEQLVPTRM